MMKRFLPVAVLMAGLACSPVAIAAPNKEMIQLQTQIQQLQDAVARLQQSNDERMGVMKDLVQQTADSVNKMSISVNTLERGLKQQQDAEGTKIDQMAGQVQSLNDSLDELKARFNKVEKMLGDIQSQQQSINGAMQNMPQGGAAPASTPDVAPMSAAPTVAPLAPPRKGAKPSAAVADNPAPIPLSAPVVAPAASAGPSADEMYKNALGDYMAAKYTLSGSEFSDLVRTHPDATPQAGNAYYYLGEIDYRAGRYASAAKNYDKLIEQFPGNAKIPAAHLHKGEALLLLKQNDQGIRELRALIQRFPISTEAMQARSKLSGMGVPVVPRVKPSN